MQIIRIILLIIMTACSKGACANQDGLAFIQTPAAAIEEPFLTEGNLDFETVDIIFPEFHFANNMDGMNMGDPGAPVHVTLFADFQCPACGGYWDQMQPALIEDYINTGKVYYFYSPFSFIGEYGQNPDWDESKKAAEAALCANDQYSFWQYHDLLYANQNGENLGAFDRDHLMTMALYLALDMETFATCLDYGDHALDVQYANDYATEMGSTFTPSFLVNGVFVGSGDLINTIDQELK